MQPIHAIADRTVADTHWGERCKHAYAWRSMLDAGVTLALGTDAPVERIEPLLNLRAATTRRGQSDEPSGAWYPEQCLSMEQAIHAYTRGSAAAERAAGRRGMLSAGMDADLVVLAPDPFVLDLDALCESQVELTMVGGHITFEHT
jgi:predicted amidohydrolase YtcJ